jgi:poly-gamma-glutamate capsule biosynthesis protein CapA/YwtB (metallophosphatase superfamily)
MNRRQFLAISLSVLSGVTINLRQRNAHAASYATNSQLINTMNYAKTDPDEAGGNIVLFFCGDVMTGRGIDQILAHPSKPTLHEPYMKSALGYVELAEGVNGPIPRSVDPTYIWGDAMAEFERVGPDLRIINLETAVTQSDDYLLGKGIHYRMHPYNLSCITAAGIDCCVLANNHVMDWGIAGLNETLIALREQAIACVGAGQNHNEARAPAMFKVTNRGRVFVLAFGSATSGVPNEWAATVHRPGVNIFSELAAESVAVIVNQVIKIKQQDDVVIISLHWGGNWGYEIRTEEREFAHRLIDEAQVDVVYGHSSHHPRGMEVYKGKLILYGCGDFINDYEGIRGNAQYRSDLTLMYFVTLNPENGQLVGVEMVPMQIRKFQLHRATPKDAQWLGKVMDRESQRFGRRVIINEDHRFFLKL